MKVQLLILFCLSLQQQLCAQVPNDSTYTSLIHSADSLFEVKKYSEAEINYRKAHSIKESSYTAKMILESMRYKTPDCGDTNKSYYKKIVNYADSLYNNEDFEKALKYYDRALLIRPKDEHVKSRVIELNDKLK